MSECPRGLELVHVGSLANTDSKISVGFLKRAAKKEVVMTVMTQASGTCHLVQIMRLNDSPQTKNPGSIARFDFQRKSTSVPQKIPERLSACIA